MSAIRRKRRPAIRSRALFMEALELRALLTTGVGVYAPDTGTFTLRNELSAGPPSVEFQFSETGGTPVTGDWNGDGTVDYGVFDPSTATWTLRYGAETGEANAGTFHFGAVGSIPVVGDWNGDGRDDIGTFLDGSWQLRLGASPGAANAGEFTFGAAGDTPVAGDWDGDGQDGIGVVNGGSWNLLQTASASAASAGTFTFAPASGFPVTGDWNGDGTDGIGIFESSSATWHLRQTATAGSADAGVFVFGAPDLLPVTGDFDGPPAPTDALATIVLPPLNLDLLGLEVATSPITITVSAEPGDGKLLGNLLSTVTGVIDLESASNALNEVLDSTIDLLNAATLNITGALTGPLDDAEVSESLILELFVAPVHLELLGLHVDTSTIRVTITAKSGEGLLLGNVVTELIHLFDPPLPDQLDIDFLNGKLDELLVILNEQLPDIEPAPTEPVPVADGQILHLTVPALDLNLLGLVLETSPITVNATAESGDGALLGNVLTTVLNTLDATPENLAELNTNINEILAKVVGVLNVADLTLASGAVDALPAVLEALVNPTLTAPEDGSTTPILDLLIASTDGTTPPVQVDLLGLTVTTSNIEAHLSAETGEGQILGNLLYNVAHLADAGGPFELLNLLNLLGSGSLDVIGDITGGSVTPDTPPPQELLTIQLDALNLDLLGLEIATDPIIVNLATQAGDGKLLGNLLGGISTLLNVEAVSDAVNNILSTTVGLLNAASLAVDGVGTGEFDNADAAVTEVLELYVAPVYLDLLGLIATTEPIHLTITARSGAGLVLGNVITELANLFNPPLPDQLDIDFLNQQLEQLLENLNEQIPIIPPAEVPPAELETNQILELTVPPIDLDLLGLVLQSSPITVSAFTHTGEGLLLGNILTTLLNTVDATTENLTGLSNNLNALLAKVIGVLNATDLLLPANIVSALPNLLQTLGLPTLIATESGATTEILNLAIVSGDNAGPPIDVDLLGLEVNVSDVEAQLLAKTGDGQLLGNLLYNVANLLNPGETATLLALLTQLGSLEFDVGDLPTVTINQLSSQVDPATAGPIVFRAVFSEAVTGFDASDISLSGTAGGTLTATVTPVGSAGTTYDISVSGMTSAGTVIATISSGVAADADGNLNVASTSTDNTVDFVLPGTPTVTVNQAAGQGDPSSSSSILFRVVFNEPVTGFDASDVSIGGTAGGTLSATVTPVGSAGTTYDVAVSGMTSSGSVSVTINAGAATDVDGNVSAASSSTDNIVDFVLAGVGDTIGLYDPAGTTFYLDTLIDGTLDGLIIVDVPSVPRTWIPLAGDWDGDGSASIGLYDPINTVFYLNNETDGSIDNLIVLDIAPVPRNWVPLVGDWDGDGDDTVGLYDRAGTTFYLNNETDGSTDTLIVVDIPSLPASWIPVVGDWDGDGLDTIGVYNPAGHTFYLNNETDGSTDNLIVFTTPQVPARWLPIAGDWDDDGVDTVGLYDRNGHTFYLNNETDGSVDNVIVVVTPTVPRTWLPIAGDWNGSSTPAASSARLVGEWPGSEGEGEPSSPMDVDGNGEITPLDALNVINFMNAFPVEEFPEFASAASLYDASGDGYVSPLDVLLIANHLNRSAGADSAAESDLVLFVASPSTEAGSAGVSAAEGESSAENARSENRPAASSPITYWDDIADSDSDDAELSEEDWLFDLDVMASDLLSVNN